MKKVFAHHGKRTLKIIAALLAAVMTAMLAPGGVSNAVKVRAAAANVLHYWAFDGDLTDASGKLHVAAKNGDAAFSEGHSGSALAPADGGAVKSEELTEDTLGGFSMGAWFKLAEGAEEWNIIMSKGDTGGDGNDRYQIHIGHASPDEGGGTLLVYAPAANNGFANENDGPFVPYDTWTHVAVTFNGNTLRFFVNGELYGEKAASAPLGKSLKYYNTVTVGALNHDGETFCFNGCIDDAFYAAFALKPEDVAAAYADGAKLKSWADGSAAITPDVPDEPVITPAPTEPPASNPGGGNTVLYWPLDNSAADYSHLRVDLDFNETDPVFREVKLNGGAELYEGIYTEGLPEGMDLTEFTVAFWAQWDENQHDAFAALFAIAEKDTDHHFELYLSVDGDKASLSSYSTGGGQDVRGLAEIERGKLYHIACTNGSGGFVVYVDGEEVYRNGTPRRMKGLDPEVDYIALGSLCDGQLVCAGYYDELILADHELSAELIKKLYSDPAGARADVIGMVEANYPEGYTRPTEVPTKAPTAVPTQAPMPAPTDVPADPTDGPAADEKTPIPGKTTAPSGNNGGVNKGDRPASKAGLIVAIVAAAAVIAGAAVAAVLVSKKKKGGK